VQDEDDASRVMRLDAADVRKLGEPVSSLHRGDRVLAVFPETTSFYRGAVAKNPKGANSDVLVRFDDDEDEAGRPLIRRVPARFVLYDDESESPTENVEY
jgi:SAGA-associated factor 29